ncbi:protein BLISTER isoform X1 [Neltuma alba]|uniref:protein BLISTER isoform X1 n=1 Tax=Neltuma alba TaxID=207710 RepID=UPI0010A36E69|nr:protein BLISTER-like isoform X1 [Prosopis alba]
MASAQVLQNSAASSRKQEHLEAGKRRLDEFRKKKAAKKAASTSQARNSDGQNGKQPSENEHVRANELNGVSTSDGIGGTVYDTSAAVTSNDKSLNLFTQSSNHSVAGITSSERDDLNSFPTILTESHANIDEASRYNASGLTGSIEFSQNEGNQVNDIYTVHTGGVAYGTTYHENITLNSQEIQPFDSNSNLSTLHGMNQSQSTKSSSSMNDYTVADHWSYFSSKFSPQSSADTIPQIKPINSSTVDSGYMHGALYGGHGDSLGSGWGKTITSSGGGFPDLLGATMEKLDSTGSNSGHSPNHIPTYSVHMESSSRRSRPSFLDSLNVARPSSGAPYLQAEKDSSSSNHPEPGIVGTSGSTYFPNLSMETKTMVPFSNSTTPSVQSQFDHSTSSSNFNSNSQDILSGSAKENNVEKKHDIFAPTQNEDFAALEQHIEDLTQEKFSLQRALEASRSLAESLAAENSSLTDNYNQQRSIVNQLKSDMERLQGEIKLHLIELESVRNEYANAQLECNAADERAKLLASEVIGLEDKALRLRSSELKLEKQLENAQAEITSYRKKMSSLETDRHDLHSTINALQEEKKLLQSKVRKASGIGNSIENSTNKKDVSTSTEDIASTAVAATSSSQETHDSATDYSGLPFVPEVGHSTFGASPANIPPDQTRLIENINALISELALEKEELLKALASESSECSRMKELNKDLSRKLEAQTQRLEFLTAQSMAGDHAPAKQPDVHTTYDNAPYADEGDEVVERVLGWIMKLFPGGPAKRRTSKLN